MSQDSFDGFSGAPPMIIVISGPSGVGKTIICNRLIEEDPELVRSVSATTRPPRSDEKDGEDYFFWSSEQFRSAVEKEFFLEWAEVHHNLYGTPMATIEDNLAEGRSPVLDVDVQGGRSVKSLRPEAVLILVAPPSMAVLEERLRGRGTDGDPEIQQRLAIASRELGEWRHYDYVLVNDDLEHAVSDAQAFLTAEQARVSRRKGGS